MRKLKYIGCIIIFSSFLISCNSKTEFQKFGDVIAKAKKKIDQAGTCLDDVSVRVRSIDRTFRKVELQDESAGHLIQQKEDA